jgi:hypothetical protein
MKKVYYEKIEGKFVPVLEYDSDFLDAFRKGSHLVMSYPGGQSRRYDIDPAYAPMVAAGRFAEDAIAKAITNASELRPQKTPITPGQQKAWKKLAKEFGDELCTLQGASTADCARAGVIAMQEEADKLMANPAVKKAYEHFMLICKLTKENNG